MTNERRKLSTDYIVQEDRRVYSADFMAKVALSAIREEKSQTEIAIEYAIHPNLVGLWKQQALNNLSKVFEDFQLKPVPSPKLKDNRHAKIGQLMAENDFLTKVLGR